MSYWGNLLLWVSFFVSAGSFILVLAGRNSRKILNLATLLACLPAVSLLTCLLLLAIAFLKSDFSIQYVWQYSNRTMPWWYKVSAVWGGMDGSMLLWTALLSVATALFSIRLAAENTKLASWAGAFANSAVLYFLFETLLYTNPFRPFAGAEIPADGRGLSPLLQNPFMAFHPPLFYAGATLSLIPASLGVAALITGALNNHWIRIARPWVIACLILLTIGIFLGAQWAYLELGWGGFWGWDPVENASLFPWLFAVIFLHTLRLQQRSGGMKLANVWLSVAPYLMGVFGMFLTRTGVVQSIHAFTSTQFQGMFLSYLAITIAVLAVLTIRSAGAAERGKIRIYLLSREFLLFLCSIILGSLALTIIWGVVYPIISGFLTGTRQSLGEEYYNSATPPIFIFMLFVMSLVPLSCRIRRSGSRVVKLVLIPATVACIAAAVLWWAGIREFAPILAYCLSAYAISGILYELRTGNAARGAGGAGRLRNPGPRIGGHIVHLGVCITAIGLTASMTLNSEITVRLDKGDFASIGRYSLYMDSFEEVVTGNYTAKVGTLKVSDVYGGGHLGFLKPELRSYINGGRTSEASLRVTLKDDLYVIFASFSAEDSQHGYFKIHVNPLQIWIGIGVLVMLAGMIILLPIRRLFK